MRIGKEKGKRIFMPTATKKKPLPYGREKAGLYANFFHSTGSNRVKCHKVCLQYKGIANCNVLQGHCKSNIFEVFIVNNMILKV